MQPSSSSTTTPPVGDIQKLIDGVTKELFLPQFAVTHSLNPYDNSRFGDKLLGSILPAFLVCERLGEKWRLIANKNCERDLEKVAGGKQTVSQSEFALERELTACYDYVITIQAKRGSSLMETLHKSASSHNTCSIDLEETPPEFEVVLSQQGNEVLTYDIQNDDIIETLQFILTDRSLEAARVLINIPYSVSSEFDRTNFVTAEGRAPLPPSLIDFSDIETRNQLRSFLASTRKIPLIPYSEGVIRGAVNIRTGGGIDSKDTTARYPAKFPELDWYLSAFKALKDQYPNEVVEMHVATDGDANAMKETLTRLCEEKGIERIIFTSVSAFPEGISSMDVDLWGCENTQVFVGADSAFFQLMTLISKSCECIITPKADDLALGKTNLKVPLAKAEAVSGHVDTYQGVETVTIKGKQLIVSREQVSLMDFRRREVDPLSHVKAQLFLAPF